MPDQTTTLPPCGLYRTTTPIAEIPAGSLVYFHNHGRPGPGVYLPSRWVQNRAQFAGQGTLLPQPTAAAAASLQPLAREGFYRVTEAFTCCSKGCRRYEVDSLVQLGYDGRAQALLFVPEWTPEGLHIPETGLRIDDEHLARLAPLTLPERRPASEADAPEAILN